MTHPNRDEWIPFIFGEADAEARKRLDQHLAECPDCAREVAGWRRSRRRLDRWSLPKAIAHAMPLRVPVLKWALAATLVLGMGFLIGRWSAPPSARLLALRAEIESSVRSSLQTEMNEALRQLQSQTAQALARTEARLTQAAAADNEHGWRNFLEVLDAARAEDGRAVQAAFQRSEDRRDAQLVALRKDLETLASMTDEEMRRASLKLTQLASVHNPIQ